MGFDHVAIGHDAALEKGVQLLHLHESVKDTLQNFAPLKEDRTRAEHLRSSRTKLLTESVVSLHNNARCHSCPTFAITSQFILY